MRRADEADDLDILRCDGPYRDAATQPLGKALPVGCLEVRPSDSRLVRMALAGPHRQGVLKGGDRPFPILRPVADEAFAVGHAEFHLSCGPFFRLGLAGPNRKGVHKAGDGLLRILRPVAGKALRIGDAELHASGSPRLRICLAGPDRKSVLKRVRDEVRAALG